MSPCRPAFQYFLLPTGSGLINKRKKEKTKSIRRLKIYVRSIAPYLSSVTISSKKNQS